METISGFETVRDDILKILGTDRLLLREWEESDATHLLQFCNTETIANSGWTIYKTIDECLGSIRGWIRGQEMWAVVLKENNMPIGVYGLSDVNRHSRYKEVEYVISEDYRNKGYATEATKRVLEYAFSELNLMAVAACLYSYNAQSKRVAEKSGFKYEGTLRKYGRNTNDMMRYSITKEEWDSMNMLSIIG